MARGREHGANDGGLCGRLPASPLPQPTLPAIATRGARRTARVVVHSDRPSHTILRYLHRARVAVVREVGRREDDETPEIGLDALHARGQVAVPQPARGGDARVTPVTPITRVTLPASDSLEVAAVVVGPVLVEVDERVDAAMPPRAHAEVIEVRVDLEQPALRARGSGERSLSLDVRARASDSARQRTWR